MILFPNAKINLGLKVLDKRDDGFHNIETILYPVELYDILEILPSEGEETSFTSSGLEIPGENNNNLCLKAYHILSTAFHLPPVKIHLHKVIPIGAGLGGGSSDGAFTIKLLNELFSIGLSDQEMMNFSGQLGSDCAFFIRNEPVYADDRGDRFKLVEIDLTDCKIKIVTPDLQINTAMAYRMLDEEIARGSVKGENGTGSCNPGDKTGAGTIQKIIRKPIHEWRIQLVNDFEIPIFKAYPMIEAIKKKFYEEGAVYASMSGSGSSVYAIFE